MPLRCPVSDYRSDGSIVNVGRTDAVDAPQLDPQLDEVEREVGELELL
jgi:hypothetical protein